MSKNYTFRFRKDDKDIERFVVELAAENGQRESEVILSMLRFAKKYMQPKINNEETLNQILSHVESINNVLRDFKNENNENHLKVMEVLKNTKIEHDKEDNKVREENNDDLDFSNILDDPASTQFAGALMNFGNEN